MAELSGTGGRGRRHGGGTMDASPRAGVRPIWHKLGGGDRRSIGRSEEVVKDVLDDARLFDDVFAALLSPDPVTRMRAADAVEKITRTRPRDLQRHRHTLIGTIASTDQAEVRWHVAQMLPRLELRPRDLSRVLDILHAYLRDDSRIVATSAMQALAELAERDARLRPDVLSILRQCTATGSTAMKARGRKLLAAMEKTSSGRRARRT